MYSEVEGEVKAVDSEVMTKSPDRVSVEVPSRLLEDSKGSRILAQLLRCAFSVGSGGIWRGHVRRGRQESPRVDASGAVARDT